MADETQTALDEGSQLVVNAPETETGGGSIVEGEPSSQFDRLNASLVEASGEDYSRPDASVDGSTGTDDIASEPETPATPSFDADSIRLEQARQAARQFGVPEQTVGSWKNLDQAEGFLYGMRHNMATPPQQVEGNGTPKLPSLDYQVSPEWDEGIAGALGQVQKFGGGIQERFSYYDQTLDRLAGIAMAQQQQQEEAFQMQKLTMMDDHIKTLPPELGDVFNDARAQQTLIEEFQTLEAGAKARGAGRPDYKKLVEKAVWVVAGPKMKEIERNRLEVAQKQKSKGATPRPTTAKTTDRDVPDAERGFANFMAQHTKLGRLYG